MNDTLKNFDFSAYLKRFVRLFWVIIYRFKTDLCFLRASALTFNTALSVVPVLAVMFGVAKGFGIEKILEASIKSEFHDHQEVINYLIDFGYTLLEQARGGLIAGIGIITLFYTVLKLLSTVEDSLNSMWGIKISRSYFRKLIDFLALILICPIFMVISSSLTVFATAFIETLKDSGVILGHIQPYIVKILSFLPYVISTFLFAFLYSYMPNGKVKFKSALFAGIFAGVTYQILQAFYITIQFKVSKTGAIYGSFAAIPLFLLWLYFSWLIFLIGAEIVVIFQERLWDPEIIAPYRTLSQYEKKLTYLSILKACVNEFAEQKPPLSLESLSEILKMPMRLVTELTEDLVRAKLIVRTVTADGSSPGITLARNPDTLKVFDSLFIIEGENNLASNGMLPWVHAFEKIIQDGEKLILSSEYDVAIKDVNEP